MAEVPKSKHPSKSIAASHPFESLIHVIRGQKVMLDPDLAALYQVEPRALIQAVKRNAGRFPSDFMFQLSHAEAAEMRSQSVISSKRGIKYQPLAFTDHGVAMLSAVLRSDRAVQMSIGIIRAFVRMRELIASNKDIAVRIEKLERGHDRSSSVIEILVEDIDRLAHDVKEMKALPPPRRSGRLASTYRHRRFRFITLFLWVVIKQGALLTVPKRSAASSSSKRSALQDGEQYTIVLHSGPRQISKLC